MKFRIHLDETFVRSELKFGVVQIDEEDPWAKGAIPTARPERWQALLDTIRRTRQPAIVYAMRRKDCDQLATLLTGELGTPCLSYHAGLETAERRTREEAFLSGQVDLIVATSAFGMGIDKEDVRTVIHWQTPPTPEALYQEAGRAGRGHLGRPARHVLLFHERDLDDAYRTLRRQIPTPHELRRLDQTLRELADHQRGTMITATDAELLQLAAIRPEVECRVALAHLERVGLVREVERLSGVLQVELVNAAVPLTSVESAIVERLHTGAMSTIIPTDIADAVPGITTASVWGALRGLERRGVVRTDDRVSLRLLDEPNAAVDRVTYLRQVARNLAGEVKNTAEQFGEQRYVRNPGRDCGDDDAVAHSIEILAALGYVTVRQTGGQRRHPDIRKVNQASSDRLQTSFDGARELVHLIQKTPQLYEVRDLAEELGLSAAEMRDAGVLLHLCGVASVDPRSWQGQQARRILIRPTADPAEQLDEAVAELAGRAREQRLRLEALRRYADIEDDPDGIDVHQAYLERYLTEPDFLEQLSKDTAEDLLAGLTVEQRDIVTAPIERQLVVLAGPGTGKTRTIVHRIAYRVRSHYVLPERVLAVTFTRAATEEVRARLAQLAVRGVRVQTLHSLAVRVTMSHWRLLGFAQEPAIVTAGQQYAILKSLGSNNPRGDLAKITLAKAGLETQDDCGQKYDDDLRQRNLVDFGDCLTLAARLLRTDVGRLLRDQYDEVLVDEFQDLSPAQIDLINAITNRTGQSDQLHLTVVGDPRQAIFQWNGADPQTLVDWYADADLDARSLSANHRSAPEILQLANATINNVLPSLPSITPALTIPGKIHKAQENSEAAMLAAVADQVKQWQADGIADHEIAVLAFTGKVVQSIGQQLTTAGIASHIEGLANVSDTDAFDAATHGLTALDDDEFPDDVLPTDVLDRIADVQLDLAAQTDDFRDDWERLRAAVDERSVTHSDLGQCLSAIKKSDGGPANTSGVTVTTLHKAKGLEWDAVAVTDLGADSFNKGQEGCRLLYVGITRARQHLHLSWVGGKTQWLPG